MKKDKKNGIILVTVVCFTAVLSVLALGIFTESVSQIKQTRRQTDIERAFFVAEAGVERAASYVRRGGATPTNMQATINNSQYSGKFKVTIIQTPDPSETPTLVSANGAININPNSSPQHQFVMITSDGQTFTRDDLQAGLADYSGQAFFLHVKPKGSSDQTITVDGSSYTLDKNKAYTFQGGPFAVSLTNDSRNTNGLAMGQWWIYLNGNNIQLGDDSDVLGGVENYMLFSVGTVGNARKAITVEGLREQSWARYALWYDNGPGDIWIKEGEVFNGPVHANTWIYLRGNPIFNALISTVKNNWGSGSDTSQVAFNAGYLFNAQSQTVAAINFTSLYNSAALVVTGETKLALLSNQMTIVNKRIPSESWITNTIDIPSNELFYVQSYSQGSTKSTGIVYLAGTIDARLTIAADWDIIITNHIQYAVDPSTNDTCEDALGLIAGRDIMIDTCTPSNLIIYAHLIATGLATSSQSQDGKFYVKNHDSRPISGALTVYGGIVQNYRGGVGTFYTDSGEQASGYYKNYAFDTRFADKPPPYYPTLSNAYVWLIWRDK
jgi:hypothetical protein